MLEGMVAVKRTEIIPQEPVVENCTIVYDTTHKQELDDTEIINSQRVVFRGKRWIILTNGRAVITILKVPERDFTQSIFEKVDNRCLGWNDFISDSKFLSVYKEVDMGPDYLAFKGVAKCAVGDTYSLQKGIELAKLRSKRSLHLLQNHFLTLGFNRMEDKIEKLARYINSGADVISDLEVEISEICK